jgi:phenylacetate-CoA ligase
LFKPESDRLNLDAIPLFDRCMNTPLSATSGILWPALPNPTNALLLALQYQLEQSQWWSQEQLQTQQMLQLKALLTHAQTTVPYYQQSLKEIAAFESAPLTPELFSSLPLLTRVALQQQGKQLLSTALPKDHLPVEPERTSGSTGRPVNLYSTLATNLIFRALNLRNHLWHQRNFLAKAAVIRIQGFNPKSTEKRRWIEGFPSGEMIEFDSGATVTEQLQWLLSQSPTYLLTYPTNLRALVERSLELNLLPRTLQGLSTFGELLTPEIRTFVREGWGLPIVDVYSAKEVGIIALQCPEQEHYHVQSENVLVEVINSQGQPCLSGQVGRVVVTALHNYATPLIRYEIGDYAEVGASCPCGRGLPVLNQIYGRRRNMLVLPSGEQQWPGFILSNWAKLGPIQQMQAIQHSLSTMEIKMVVTRPLTAVEEERLRTKIATDFQHQFDLQMTYVDRIPRSDSGKHEDFISKVRFEEQSASKGTESIL